MDTPQAWSRNEVKGWAQPQIVRPKFKRRDNREQAIR